MNRHRTHALARWLAAGAAALSAATALAAGQVEVRYLEPEKFRDVGRNAVDRERTLASLTQYLQQFRERLPDGQTLRVEVADIDLAGEIHPSMTLNDVRVVRGGADWPHMRLKYTLLDAANRTLKSGDARLSDPAYQFSQRGGIAGQEELAYEKRMLKNWFDDTIVAARR